MRKKDRASVIGPEEEARLGGSTAVPIGRHWFGRAETSTTVLDDADLDGTGLDGTGLDGTATDGDEHDFDLLGRRAFDDGIVEMLVGDANDSAALARWRDQLHRYVEQQGALDALRLRSSSEPPWPAPDNPMLGYLVDRSTEIASGDDLDAVLTWLAANAWFEGVIAERARVQRRIDED